MSGNLQSHTANNSKILEIQAISERVDEEIVLQLVPKWNIGQQTKKMSHSEPLPK